MFLGRGRIKVKIQLALIILLYAVTTTCVENYSATRERFYNEATSDVVLGHYLSTLPSGVSLEDVALGRPYTYDGVPPTYYFQNGSVIKKSKKQVTARNRAALTHDCKYCRERYYRQRRNKTNSQKHGAMRPRGYFLWPIDKDKFWISCYYGRKSRGRLHKGLDMAAISGTPVKAAASGVIEMATEAGTFGNMVLIKHSNGYKTRYAHLDSIVVEPGTFVPKGRLVGHVGNTGRVRGQTGEHLHFELLYGDRTLNPIKFLS